MFIKRPPTTPDELLFSVLEVKSVFVFVTQRLSVMIRPPEVVLTFRDPTSNRMSCLNSGVHTTVPHTEMGACRTQRLGDVHETFN